MPNKKERGPSLTDQLVGAREALTTQAHAFAEVRANQRNTYHILLSRLEDALDAIETKHHDVATERIKSVMSVIKNGLSN